jgi:tight adherence protein C
MDAILQIAILLAVFTAVVALTVMGMRRLESIINVQRRLTEGAARTRGVKSASSVVIEKNVRNPILAWVQASTSINNEKDRGALTLALRRAGFDSPSAAVWFVIARFSLAIGLPLLFLFSQSLSGEPMTGLQLSAAAMALCATGFIAPQAIVDRMGGRRKVELEHEFPDSLDLMVVCVEAGLGLEASFVRVASEVTESHPRISHEFGMISDELRAGRTRAEALRNLGERTDVPALRSFSALLIQTDALGTSIAQTLRTYSQEMREHRFLAAEEKAMRIPVLMTIPLVACILPVVVSALLLPPMIDLARDFGPALSGGG